MDKQDTNILEAREDGLLTITLNVPERRNALTTEIVLDLREAVQRAARDSEVRAVLLQGAGGNFCVGGDVRKMVADTRPPTFEEKRISLRRTSSTATIIHDMPKPVVAAVEGAAAGAGLALALACDFRVAGENSVLTTAFAKVAVSGDYGCAYYLTQMLGSAKARELMLLSPRLSGREAFDLGLVTRLVSDEQVVSSARELAQSLAQGPSITLGYMKKNINNAEQLSLEDCLDSEVLYQCRCLQTEDYQEAAKAFVEKRKPKFSGC